MYNQVQYRNQTEIHSSARRILLVICVCYNRYVLPVAEIDPKRDRMKSRSIGRNLNIFPGRKKSASALQ